MSRFGSPILAQILGGGVFTPSPTPTPTPAPSTFGMDLTSSPFGVGTVDIDGVTQGSNVTTLAANSGATPLYMASQGGINTAGVALCGGIKSGGGEMIWDVSDADDFDGAIGYAGYCFINGTDFNASTGYYFYASGANWIARRFGAAGAFGGTLFSVAVTGRPKLGYLPGANPQITIYNQDGSVAQSLSDTDASKTSNCSRYGLWNNGSVGNIGGVWAKSRKLIAHNGAPS